MQPRVTVVLVARNGAPYLPRTLAALAAQVRRPDSAMLVDDSSGDDSAQILLAARAGQVITTPGRRSFGAAVSHAVQAAPPQATENEWLWLLGHDNAPEPGALAALLGAVEVAPSVAIAGPKLMLWSDASVITNYGETLTRFGRSLPLVSNELDQAQHDLGSDLLGVAAGGMLVRRQVWVALGGFDRALSSTDAALDFCIRARIAGHRVVGVPAARVASAGPPELFGRKSLSVGAQNRIRRAAQLHRRLVYSPPLAVPLHWLSLFPLAILRSFWHLIAKRPGSIGGEFAAAFGVAFDGSVPAARRTLRRNRLLGWASIGALRIPWSEVRERRVHERSLIAASAGLLTRERPGFFAGGGAWVVLLAAVAGVIGYGRFADAAALSGGGLVPLSSTVGELWSHVGYGWRDVGSGFVGAADPFSYVLAALGSLTFWAPSFSVILLYLAALPLAALAAWWCAARFSVRPWAPATAAAAWALAPPFLVSLGEGHLGAVIAHILLPSLVLAVVSAARNWSAAALAALLFAAVAASAPILVPALLVGLVAWILANPSRVLRLIGIPIPAAALFAPLVARQVARGDWLALVADPGVPAGGAAASGWQLALGSPQAGLAGWQGFLASLGVAPHLAPLAVTVLLAPFAVLAVLGLFLPGTRRSVPAMLVALLGFGTAVIGSHIEVTIVGSQSIPVWPGAALSLYWLGLVGGMVVALEALSRRAALPALVAALGLVAIAVPSLTVAGAAATTVVESNGRLLPAFASAEAVSRPWLGTLELTAQPDGGVAATIHRGQGTTLDERSTLAQTDTTITPADARLAELAGNLASRSGFDIAGELDDLQIGFVLLPDAHGEAAAARQRVAEALDGNRLLTPIGSTANGFLWHYAGLAEGEAPGGPPGAATALGTGILVGQGIVFGVTLLLAIPTTRRRRVRSAAAAARPAPIGNGDADE